MKGRRKEKTRRVDSKNSNRIHVVSKYRSITFIFLLSFSYHSLIILVGNFVDLVNKKFYDGMPIQKEEQLTLQTGKPKNGDGYIDPKTKEVFT